VTRGQRSTHFWIWILAMPIAGFIALAAILARPDPVPPSAPPPTGAAP